MSAPLPDVNSKIEELAFELDRKWFGCHPGRAYHLRRPVPGEVVASCSLSEVEPLVLVKYVIPGFWIRLSFSPPRQPCSCDRCLGELWERVAPAEIQSLAVEMAAITLRKAP